MQSGNNNIITETVKAINSLAGGDSKPLIKMGITDDIIHNIHSFMNIYSPEIPRLLIEIIALTLRKHNPGKSFIRIEQFARTSPGAFNIQSFSDDLPFILSELFSTSGALSSRLSSENELIGSIDRLEKPLLPHIEKEYYQNIISGYFTDIAPVSEKIKCLHRIHISQLVRICARNAVIDNGIDEITAELSSLADAMLDSCLNVAYEELNPKSVFPVKNNSFFVLGLGKLGGKELNVSSDVDIIYLYDDLAEFSVNPENPELSAKSFDSFDSLNFYTKLAERMTVILTEPTEFGYLYRVDTRLRADGSAGPLVRSTDDYIRYLEMRGKAWERQMLLKARPVAGNIEAGRAFLKSVERFIFTTSITRSPHREIAAIKSQIEARIIADGSKKTHLKLMPGGIRDIEFIVQCLQLIMGGMHPQVRCSGTLPALSRLQDTGALSGDEYSLLKNAYILYRRIENALQWRELLPVFNLPESTDELNDLISYLDIPDLAGEIDRMMKSVRDIYDDIFYAEKSESFDEMAVRSAINPTGDDKVKRFIENLGFNDPEKSAKDLSMLVFGKGERTGELSIHPSIERFLPKLLKTLSELSDPEGTLEHFKLIAESYNARAMLFDIMENNPRFFEMLISITHGSVFISELLMKDPSLLDWLVESGEILHSINKSNLKKELKDIDSKNSDNERFNREFLKVKLREKLRIGTRDITGLSNTAQTFSELSVLAECIVTAVFQRAYSEMKSEIPSLANGYSFCIIAVGKLGCSMMDFGSDLDIIFVYRSSKGTVDDIEIPEHSIRLAQRILSYISGGGGALKIFDVDARLRPEGGNSPLAISIEEYKKYLSRRASVWERLAMIRARYLTGTDSLKDEVSEEIENFVFNRPLKSSEIKKIIKIRKTMVESSIKRYPGQINIKSGNGGISDIDFIAQTYAVHYGADRPNLRHHETGRIINALASEDILSRHDASSIIELYSFLCDVEKAIRIGSGKPVNTLHKSGIELARVSRLMGYDNIRRFRKRLEDVITLSKGFYDRLMRELLDSSSDSKKEKQARR